MGKKQDSGVMVHGIIQRAETGGRNSVFSSRVRLVTLSLIQSKNSKNRFVTM